jgi:hypothetical protein
VSTAAAAEWLSDEHDTANQRTGGMRGFGQDEFKVWGEGKEGRSESVHDVIGHRPGHGMGDAAPPPTTDIHSQHTALNALNNSSTTRREATKAFLIGFAHFFFLLFSSWGLQKNTPTIERYGTYIILEICMAWQGWIAHQGTGSCHEK